MKKKDLISIVTKESGLTYNVAGEVVDIILTTIVETIKKWEDVDITKFGKFQLKERAARNGINPKTKEPIKIAASKTMKFSVKEAVKAELN